MKTLAGYFLLVLGMASIHTSGTEGQVPSDLGKVYADKSHCLVSPEIRSEKDHAISCFCRDAIVDARYLYFTYVLADPPHYDRNVTGPFLALQNYAEERCSHDEAERLSSDFIARMMDATTKKDWKWNGPEVVRTYPPDDVLRQIKPDSRGMIQYEYTVVILQRDSSGRVVKTESFTARETIAAADLLKGGSKPSSSKTPPQH
jgi:hypothetical protein